MLAAVPVTPQPVSIGRAAECAVILPSTAVSRNHASVYLHDDGRVIIADEGSANGVEVDGKFISKPVVVSERSRITISDFSLTLERGETQQVVQRMPQVEGVEREELLTVLEARVDAGALLASTSLQLVGRGGPYDGTVFTVDKPLMTVGRVEPSDVVLDDPSISRQHAQLRLAATADRFTVLDLRSSNGTFVDGQKIKRAECADGSIVRFGDIAFKVLLVKEEDKPKRRMGRRTLWIVASLVVVLLVGVGVVAKIMQPKPPPQKKRTGPTIDEIQAKVQQAVDKGRRKLSQRGWDEAINAFESALALDPINKEAARLRERAITERQFKQAFVKGKEYFALGNKENLLRAKDVFRTIPESSVYHRDVRYQVQTINERLAEGYRIEGVSRCKARYWVQCHRALCKFFELLPEGKVVPGESRLRKQLKTVEARLQRRGFTPCEARRFLNPSGEEAPGESPAEVLAEKYHVTEIQQAIMLYFNGRIESALRQIQRLTRSRKMRPHLAAIREINRQLLIIRGKYQEGYSAFRERNVVDADRHWGIVLDADAALIPQRIESFYRRDVKRALGDLYFELGNEEFKLMRYRQAYAQWSRGKRVNGAHERLLNGMLQLEAVAEKLVKRARRLGNTAEGRKMAETAKAITEEGRPMHLEAVKLLGE